MAPAMVSIPLAPVDAVRITILMDNVTDPLLFPTPHVERTVENIRRLEILPGDIETIVLSHGHGDHVAGMEGIAKELGRGNLPVLM